MQNILISTECVADLPQNLELKDMAMIYFDVRTEEGGQFRDTKEILSQNVLEYMLGGHKIAVSVIPTANEYKNFFAANLKEYDEIIHICISSGISGAYDNANLARAKLGRDGKKVFIIDSRHLSCGQGLITIEAMKCRDNGMSSKQIVEYLQSFIPRVSTTFLANSADYLYYNKKVPKYVMDVCNIFKLHPVLDMAKGKLTLKKVYIGNYKKCAIKYIKQTLGDIETIDKQIGFLPFVGCSEEILEIVREDLFKRITFSNVYELPASATVSCNCGPKTFGVMFVRKEI